jgi:septal ring factor EnvC (AmiA/AmiB activator)
MEEQKKKRRSPEEVRKEQLEKFNARIKDAEKRLEDLKKAKEECASKPLRVNRITKKKKLQSLLDSATKSGKTPEEIAKALGIDVPDSWTK